MNTSCLIPCHKAYPHLLQCLRSLVRQFDETIVYFDNCTDGSREQVGYLVSENPGLVLISGDEQVGAQRARNLLYEESSGDLVCFFDADDYREKQSVAPLVQHFLNSGDDLGVILSPCIALVRDTLYRSEVYRSQTPEWVASGQTPELWEVLINRLIQTGGMFWRRTFLEELVEERGYVWDEAIQKLQDQNLLLDCVEAGWQVDILPILTHYYRCGWSEGQMSSNPIENQPWVFSYFDRLQTLCPPQYQELLSIRRIETEAQFQRWIQDYEKYGMGRIAPVFD